MRYVELIASGASSFEAGPAWTGDVEVELFESPTEELHRLPVEEIIGGYYRQVGVVWDGGTQPRDPHPAAAGRPMSTTHAVVEGVPVDTRHWIGGQRVASATTFTDISPIDEQPLAEIHAGTASEVDAAVAAAGRRSPPGPRSPSRSAATSCAPSPTASRRGSRTSSVVETRDNGSLLRSHRRGRDAAGGA